MDIFDILTMIGGLCLFLFGMTVMGDALERAAGSSLRTILGKLTSGRFLGFLTGLAVTSVIQSSSATTVMVVGFVNSGLMELNQVINVIMGANVGTTVTAWILSLGSIDGDSLFVQLLKPTNFTPILALIGVIYYMFLNDSKKKDIGAILLGFATLMFGMDTMSAAVSGLKDVPQFQQMFLMFQNPILGMLAGAVLTGIIQSSSASVGILQALSMTGQVTYGAAIPIIMGQNIGTCVTALLSSVGTNKGARRAALVHLSFNVLGTAIWLTVFAAVQAFVQPAILNDAIAPASIAICHSAFNILCTVLLLPNSKLLEKLAYKMIPEDKEEVQQTVELDEHLLTMPPVALERCRVVTAEMAAVAYQTYRNAVAAMNELTPELAQSVRDGEDKTDHYEDILSTYLVKLSSLQISENDSTEAATLLKAIGDLERIGDHALNLLESAEEMHQKKLQLSDTAQHEISVLVKAVDEIIEMSFQAFAANDLASAFKAEPLEQVIDDLKETLRVHHILRLQQGNCSIETGFIWSDLLTALERIGDHCSNIAGCIVDLHHNNRNTHEALRSARVENEHFGEQYKAFAAKFILK